MDTIMGAIFVYVVALIALFGGAFFLFPGNYLILWIGVAGGTAACWIACRAFWARQIEQYPLLLARNNQLQEELQTLKAESRPRRGAH